MQREKFDDEENENAERVIHIRLQSRHSSATKYHTYVKFDPEQRIAWEKIVAWYCTCSCGARTMGCCAHVTTTIWWLSVGRMSESPLARRQNLWLNLVDADLSRDLGHSRFRTDLVHQDATVDANGSDTTLTDDDMPGTANDRKAREDAVDSDYSDDDDWVPFEDKQVQSLSLTHSLPPDSPSQVLFDTPFGSQKNSDLIIAVEPMCRQPQLQLSPITFTVAQRTTRSSSKKIRVEDSQPPREVLSSDSDADSEAVRKAPKNLIQQTYLSLTANIRLQTDIISYVQTRKLQEEENAQAESLRNFVHRHVLSFPTVQLTVIDSSPVSIQSLKCMIWSASRTDMWLDAEIMNAYFSLIVGRYDGVDFLPTFFWQKLECEDLTCLSLYWNRMPSSADRRLTFIPINVGGCHWKMCVLDWRARHAFTFDPDTLPADTPTVLPLLKQATMSATATSIQDFEDAIVNTNIRQPDRFNCGTTVLLLAEIMCAEVSLSQQAFSTKELYAFRQRILLSVAAKRIQ
jgi:hypothetical protein